MIPPFRAYLAAFVLAACMIAAASCRPPAKGVPERTTPPAYMLHLTLIETGGNTRRVMWVLEQYRAPVRISQSPAAPGMQEPVLSMEIVFEGLAESEVENIRRQLAATPGVTEVTLTREA